MQNRADEPIECYRIRDYFLSALFPMRCHLCDERFNPAYESGESVFFGEEPIRSTLCLDCTGVLSDLYHPRERIVNENTVYRYLFDYNEETVQKLIFHIKFRNCPACHAFVGNIAAFAIQSRFPDAQAVIGIPRSVPLMKKYGFDQATELLKQYGKMPQSAPILDILCRDPILSQEQKGLSARQRRYNAFRSLRLKKNAVVPKTVCVLDDVVTTGSTAEAAAYLLRKAGAERIDFLFLTAAGNIIQ